VTDEGINEVVFNDQYYLAVDRREVVLYREGVYGETLCVATDFGSWTLEGATGKWFTVTPSAYSGTPQTLTVTAEPLLTGAPDREESFDIVAGTLRVTITVRQVNEPKFYLAITDLAGNPVTDLFFEAGTTALPPAAQSFRVTWLPDAVSAVDISVATMAGSPPFRYETGSGQTDFSATSTAAGASAGTPPYRVAEFIVQPPVADPNPTRASRVDFSVTHEGRTVMLPIFLRQEEGPPYAFTEAGATLTLFSHFPLGTDLVGLNKTNIPELNIAANANTVRTLVIKGNSLTDDQLTNIKYKGGTGNLLPGLSNISLPDFTGETPDYCFWQNSAGTPWLQEFSALEATTIGTYTFAYCANLRTVHLPKVTETGVMAFYQCTNLTAVYLPELLTLGNRGFELCTGLESISLPKATDIGDSGFKECTNWTTIDLPAVTMIKNKAFMSCGSLAGRRLNLGGAVITLDGSQIFYDTTTTNVELHLNVNVFPAPSGNSWGSKTWASITKDLP
jgi:hypothetical protein